MNGEEDKIKDLNSFVEPLVSPIPETMTPIYKEACDRLALLNNIV